MSLPPATLSPEEEETRFYAALGRTISQWQEVEAALSRIFCDLANPQAGSIANVAFHTVLSFDSKLGMTHAAVGLGVNDVGRAEWSPLHNRASRRNDRRNQLAHFMVAYDPTRKPGYRYHLRPNIFDARALLKWGDHPPVLNTCQLMASGASFSKLARDLGSFHRRWIQFMVPGLAEVLSRSATRPPPEPDTLTDPIAEEPEPPPES